MQTLALCLTTIGSAGQFSNEGIVLLGIIQDGIFTVFSYWDELCCSICMQFFLMDYFEGNLLIFERGLNRISMKIIGFSIFCYPTWHLKIPVWSKLEWISKAPFSQPRKNFQFHFPHHFLIQFMAKNFQI